MMGNLVILFQTLWLGTTPPMPPLAPDHPVPVVSGQRLEPIPPRSPPSMPLMKSIPASGSSLNADKFPPERNKAGRGLDTEQPLSDSPNNATVL